MKRFARGALTLAFWLTVWAALALLVHRELLLPAPWAVVRRLCEFAATGTFWRITAVSIGRVLTTERRRGYGHKILDAGIAAAREKYGAETIRIEAQTYARKLYEDHGFRQDGEEFLEDDIPHIPMIWHAPKD